MSTVEADATTPERIVSGRRSARSRIRVPGTTLERLLSILSPVMLLGLWELLAQLRVIDTRFFPAPSSIFGVLWDMMRPSPQFPTGELWFHLGISLQRIVI